MSNVQLPFNLTPAMLQQLLTQIGSMTNAQATSPHLSVRFYKDAVENPRKTELAGRPMFDEKEFVEIRWVGDQKRELHAPANQPSLRDPMTNNWLTYKQRFPLHYDAFKKDEIFLGEGTPIKELPFLNEACKAELRSLNIHTAEALAALDGPALTMLGANGRNWKMQASAYIAKANDMSAISGVVADNKALQAKIDGLQAELRAYMAGERPPSAAPPVLDLPPEARPGFKPDFSAWSDMALKDFIKDRLGVKPPGTPKHEDLVQTVENLWTQENAEQTAA